MTNKIQNNQINFQNFSNKQKENTILYDAQQNSPFRLKQWFGLQLLNGFYLVGIPFTLYMIYETIINQSLLYLTILLILFAEPHINPNKVSFAYKTAQWLEFHKWFDRYTIISEEPEIDQKKTLFTWMPHSVFCFPMLFSNFIKNNPINQVLLGSRGVLKSPWMGTVSQWFGYQSVDPQSFKKLMKQEQNIGFVPGGFEEATVFSHKEYRVFNNNRKGFIKYALQHGYNIHPVFVFNERKGYWTKDFCMNFRLKLNKLKLPGLFFTSWYGYLPNKKLEIKIVVGKKVEIPLIQQPSKEQIQEYYEKYIESIKGVFNRNVDKYDPGAKLVFWGENNK